MRQRVVLSVLLPWLCWGTVVFAQTAPENDRVLAQSLFEQGKALMQAGDYNAACPKLEASQRLEPAGGTLMNVALCHEQQGKTATAWADFKAALGVARRDGRSDRVEAAEQHIAALEPLLPRLTLSVAGRVEGLVISLDGTALSQAIWDTPVPIDPGAHELTAQAPGRQPWSQKLEIARSEQKTVPVPLLEPSAAPAPPPAPVAPVQVEPAAPAPAPVPPGRDEGPRKGAGTNAILGWVTGGVGVAALGVGTYFGIQTFSKRSQSDKECPTDTTCTDRGAELNDDAWTSAWLADVAIGLGVVGVGVGAYLVLTDSGSETKAQASNERRGELMVRAGPTPHGGDVRLSWIW
jgi:hypothetical protein